MSFETDRLIPLGGALGAAASEQLANSANPYETGGESSMRIAREQAAQRTAQRYRASELATRRIPAYTDPSGNIEPVRDAGGAALTNYDRSANVAWDGGGKPVELHYGETGAPELRDAYASAQTRTDEKTGDQYQVRQGLPWKWTGRNEDVAQRALEKEQDKALRAAVQAKGGQLTLEEAAVKRDETLHKGLKNMLVNSGALTTDEFGELPDRDTANKSVEAFFNEQYGAPEANKTSGFFSSDLSDEAKQRRSQIDQQKAAMSERVNRFYDLQDRIQARRVLSDQTRVETEGLRALQAQRELQQLQAAGVQLPEEARQFLTATDTAGTPEDPDLGDVPTLRSVGGVQRDPATGRPVVAIPEETLAQASVNPEARTSMMSEIGKGIKRGWAGAISGLGGFLRMLGAEGAGSAVSEYWNEVSQENQAAPDIKTFDPANPRWWAARLPEVAAGFIPQLTAALATGGSSLPVQIGSFAVMGGGMMAGQTYNEAMQDRVSKGESLNDARDGALGEAAVVGVVGSVLEAIPGMAYFSKNPVTSAIIRNVLRTKLAQRITAGAVAEGATEVLQEIMSDLAAYGYRDDANRFADAVERYQAVGLLSAVLGGTIGVGMHAASPQQEPAPQQPEAQQQLALPSIEADEIIPPGQQALPGPTRPQNARTEAMLQWPEGVQTISPSGETIVIDPTTGEQGQRALPGPTRPAEQRNAGALQWPHGDARTFSPSGETIQLPVSSQDLVTENATADVSGNVSGNQGTPGAGLISEGGSTGPGEVASIAPNQQFTRIEDGSRATVLRAENGNVTYQYQGDPQEITLPEQQFNELFRPGVDPAPALPPVPPRPPTLQVDLGPTQQQLPAADNTGAVGGTETATSPQPPAAQVSAIPNNETTSAPEPTQPAQQASPAPAATDSQLLAQSGEQAGTEGVPTGQGVAQQQATPDTQEVKLARGAMNGMRAQLSALGAPTQPKVGTTSARNESGIETSPDGTITIDPVKLAASTKGLAPRAKSKFIQRAIAEEVVHVATLRYAEQSPENRAKLETLGREQDELDAFMAEAYNGWENLNPFQKGAEKARAIIQQRWQGNITEAAYKFLKDFLKWLRGSSQNLKGETREVVLGIEKQLGRYEKDATGNNAGDEISALQRDLDETERQMDRLRDAYQAKLMKGDVTRSQTTTFNAKQGQLATRRDQLREALKKIRDAGNNLSASSPDALAEIQSKLEQNRQGIASLSRPIQELRARGNNAPQQPQSVRDQVKALNERAERLLRGESLSAASPEGTDSTNPNDNRNERTDGTLRRSQEEGSENAPNSLESATRDIGRSAEAIRQLQPSRTRYGREFEALYKWAEENDRIIAPDFLTRPEMKAGMEHRVWYTPSDGKVYKATLPNQFGQGFHGDATALEYLNRLQLQNEVFGDDIQLEGIAVEKGKMLVITSQPYLAGVEPNSTEVEAMLQEHGFQPLTIQGSTVWYNPTENVALGDAHTGNFVRTESGAVLPIDVILAHPKGTLKTLIDRARNHGGETLSAAAPMTTPPKAPNVRSAAFKRWFGQSKVVDENDNPLVVYHGTNADFTTFDLNFLGTNTGSADYGDGFYFSTNREEAGWGSKIGSYYLSLQKPLKTELMSEEFWEKYGGEDADSAAIRENLISEGYDGVIAPGQVVAFYPNQIKSATANDGTFDADDNSMLSAAAPNSSTATGNAAPPVDQNADTEQFGPILRVRLGRAFLGTADVLERTPGLEHLGKAIRKHVDTARKLQGEITSPFRAWDRKYNRAERNKAMEEFERYQEQMDNKRFNDAKTALTGSSAAGQELVQLWKDAAKKADATNKRIKLQVRGQDGKWREIGSIRDYFPRSVRPDILHLLQDPTRDPGKWKEVVRALIDEGHIKTESEAHSFLRSKFNNESAFDHLGHIEKAREIPLPTMMYDYSFDAARRYMVSWAERVGQVEAYGQAVDGEKDLFDQAIEKTFNEPTKEYIKAVQDRAYGVRPKSFWARAANALNQIATLTMLGNPATVAVNLISGIGLNAASMGVKPALKAAWEMQKAGDAITDAYERGILQNDLMNMTADLETLDNGWQRTLAEGTSSVLKWTGYHASEEFVRAHGLLTAKAFLRQALAANKENPQSKASQQYRNFISRHHIDPDALLQEDGVGETTDKFFRSVINTAQGGYRFDQVPVFADTPIGRFLFKFGKWGFQQSRFAALHVLAPLKKGDVRPLIRYALITATLGSGIEELKELLFGTPKRTATWDEIGKTLDDDQKRGLALIAGKITNNIISAGGGGILMNYAQSLQDIATRSRFKNPLEPAGLALLKNTGDFGLRAWEQGKLTGRDLDDFMRAQLSLYRTTESAAAKALDAFGVKFRAQQLEMRRQDLQWLGVQTRRFADEIGVEANRTSLGRVAKTPESPVQRRLFEALSIGDTAAAKEARDEIVSGLTGKDRGDALNRLKQQVRARQPIRVGSVAGEGRRELFLSWAQKRLGPGDVSRVKEIDRTFRQTASLLGLMSASGSPVDKQDTFRKLTLTTRAREER